MTTLLQAFSGAFIVIAFVTLIWPFNAPLAAGAYRIYFTARPLPFEAREFWLRSAMTSLILAVITVAFLFILYLLVEVMELKELQPELVVALLFLYLPTAIACVFWVFALDDM